MPNYAPIYDALNLLTRLTSGSLEYCFCVFAGRPTKKACLLRLHHAFP
jgi:hypothetical protein